MSSEDIKQLQLLIDKKNADFKEDMRSKRGKIADRDYQRILHKHNQEMNDLQNMLDREKLRMEQTLKDKLTARRRRPQSASSQHSQADAVSSLGVN